jgi:uncharacterized protein YggU (UPF0235/DUF167 family)
MFVHVIVTPHSRKEVHIRVREPAERNMANKRVIELIARVFQVPATQVRILTGHRSPSKMVCVET